MPWDKKARLAHGEKMRASHARRRDAEMQRKEAALRQAGEFDKELNQVTRAFFVNPHTSRITPVDLSDAVRNIYMMTFYRDGTVSVVEVI